MPNSLAEFIRYSPLLARAWWIAAAATLYLAWCMLPHVQGYNIAALQLAFSQSDFQNLLSLMSDAQLRGFAEHYRYDFLFPCAYSLWLCCTLGWLMRETVASTLLTPILYLPMAAGLFDLAENSQMAVYALDFFQAPDSAVFWHAAFASVKWGLLAVCFVTLIGLTLKWLLSSRR